jgi:murein DD-endopeptidase MepM/ murein hydrolase activator NlpD
MSAAALLALAALPPAPAPASPALAAGRPTVAMLSVPASASPGAPPPVSLELRDPSARRVQTTVAIVSLHTRRAVLADALGWVRAGAKVVVRWPGSARLAAGTYHVSVHARDEHGQPLLRTSAASGVATLTVAAAVSSATPVLKPSGGGGAVAETAPSIGAAEAPTPAQTVAAGAVFPVAGEHSFGGPENRFGAPRGNHVHQGQDVLAPEGLPVVAPLAGEVTWTSYQAEGAGYYAVEHTAIGLDFMFAHCQAGSLAVLAGRDVTAGQQICRIGQTGDATTSHLHFEVWVGRWQAAGGRPIDPLPYLEAWEARG